jgi:hypothetical protein
MTTTMDEPIAGPPGDKSTLVGMFRLIEHADRGPDLESFGVRVMHCDPDGNVWMPRAWNVDGRAFDAFCKARDEYLSKRR